MKPYSSTTMVGKTEALFSYIKSFGSICATQYLTFYFLMYCIAESSDAEMDEEDDLIPSESEEVMDSDLGIDDDEDDESSDEDEDEGESGEESSAESGDEESGDEKGTKSTKTSTNHVSRAKDDDDDDDYEDMEDN
jgi:hypothetical protein